jgi:hypothetical protein
VMSIGFFLMPLNLPDPGTLGIWLLFVIIPLVVAIFGFRLRVRMRSLGMTNLMIATNYTLAVIFTCLIVLTGEAGRGGRLSLVYLISASATLVLWGVCSVVFVLSIPSVLLESILSRKKNSIKCD